MVSLPAGAVAEIEVDEDPTLVARGPVREIEPKGVIDGRYRVVRRLARGGMGAVWEVLDESSNQVCALKLLLVRRGNDSYQRRRFEREAVVGMSLDHPNCVRFVSSGVDGRVGPYLVMERLLGPTLQEELPRRAWALSEIASWLEPVASALDFVHARGLVHRDVKPSNIVMALPGLPSTIKLIDFGLVTHSGGRERLTEPGLLAGTFSYVAPELVRDEPPTCASDVYSLGVVGYRLASGRLPFDAPTLHEALLAKAGMRPEPVCDRLGRPFNVRVAALFDAVLDPDPAQRPRAATEFVEQLRVAARCA